ncbi:hypothetical protein JXL21_05640 [Candidatus Bathyarchaeota archaeon]|nr:hypothetical protein [Candidatus Bathyarchaeota archaeon]
MEVLLLNLLLAILASILAIYMASTRQHRRARLTAVLLLAGALWCYGYGLEMFFTSLEDKLFWAKFQFIGRAMVNAYPLFLFNYFEDDRYITRRNVALRSVVPAAIVLLAFTNGAHGLVFEAATINLLDLNGPLIITRGFAFNLFQLYMYVMIASANIYAIRRISEKHSNSIRIFIGGLGIASVPLIASFYTDFYVNNTQVSYMSLAFTAPILLLMFLVPSRFRLGSVLPLAYASMIGGMGDMVLVSNMAGKVFHVNPSAREKLSEIHQIPADTVEGKPVSSLIPQLNEAHGSPPPEGSVVALGGGHYHLSSFMLRNRRGKANANVYVLRDISDRIRVEDNLQTLHLYATEIAKAADMEDIGEITYQTLYDSLGFKAGGLIVASDGCMSPQKTWGVNDVWVNTSLIPSHGVTDLDGESKINEIQGESIDYAPYQSMLITPISSESDSFGFLFVLEKNRDRFDSTDRMLLETLSRHLASSFIRLNHEKQLKEIQKKEIKQILEGANRVSSLVRHDLRGPLQTIRNASYLIKKSPANIEQMAPVIDKSVDYMVKVLEDLSYTDHKTLDKVNLDLNNLIIQSLRQIIIPHGVEIKTNFTKEIKCPVDKVSIHRVFDNLIRNSIDAMPKGGTLSVSTERQENVVELVVEDTGQGIENLRDVSVPFKTTKRNGMGLGLVSCRQAVEAHGGSIRVESEVGVGTRFIIDLPCQCSLDPPQKGINATSVNAMIKR